MMLKNMYAATLMVLSAAVCSAQQKQVVITLDDAPLAVWPENTPIGIIEEANQKLLTTITQAKVPVTIFINESGLVKEGQTDARIKILKQWIDHPLVTLGNHTYSHASYTNSTTQDFKDEIVKGEVITKKLLEGTNKSMPYFRFPYNATGKDSVARNEMQAFLTGKGYISTPFTIESSDYLFNTLYQDALNSHDNPKAASIGKAYVDYTLYVFDFFEKLSWERYKRSIPQIYLCHDNQLNADYLSVLIDKLKEKKYQFTDLNTVLADRVYRQQDHYAGEFGFSWFYRWEKDVQVRKGLLREQPDPPQEYYTAYMNLIRKPR